MNTSLRRKIRGLNELLYIKLSERHLAHNKHSTNVRSSYWVRHI